MRAASGVGLQVLGLIGTQAENLIEMLTAQVRSGLERATAAALEQSFNAAAATRRGRIADAPDWLTRAIAIGTGAAGGFGGLPSALAELPVTVTVLLRAIQDVAAEHGFDPAAENVQFDCVHVFTAAGPLADDDSADLGFLTVRMALTGRAMNAVIARVAPRLALVMGQKLAAQAVPVLGAVAGAATNYAYTSYYQDMAHVHFGLRSLAIEADIPQEELVARLRQKMGRTPSKI